ncbi:MAG: DNA polymerase/3'-5' exonuclease PolX [Gemmataceae bacterium]
MDKHHIARILDLMGTLLELKGENPFRCNAYHNAARAVDQLEGDIGDWIASDRLRDVPGIGASMEEKIRALYTTGRLEAYEQLVREVPAGLVELLRIPGMGPKKAQALYKELGIDSLAKLEEACRTGQVAKLKGFGEKTQSKILEALAFLEQAGQRVLLIHALELGEPLLEVVRKHPGTIRAELCGSVRRRKETIGDLDILASSRQPEALMDRFVRAPGIRQVVARGETKCSVTLDNGLNCDLRIVPDEAFPFALQYFTGSKEHNIVLRSRAQDFGLKLSEYSLSGADKDIPCRDEADIYHALQMDYIPPELRENTGEIEAAIEHRLPQLIQATDLVGTFHCHTDWSDGRADVESMVQAARKLGLKYLGIADHSQSLKVAGGLSPERVRQQHALIDRLNSTLKGFRIFKGTECDILPDGSLDYPDEVLELFDYVVVSVHSHFNLSQEEMTQRLLRALAHPRTTMLGHATGRLLLRREGYALDVDRVLRACAERGVLVEINAQPDRLDLDWIHVKHGKNMGVKFVINPDAHSTAELGYLRFGIDVARRGWLEKDDVFNTQSLARVTRFLSARRSAR